MNLDSKEKPSLKNNDRIFVPIYLGIVGIAGLILFVTSYFN